MRNIVYKMDSTSASSNFDLSLFYKKSSRSIHLLIFTQSIRLEIYEILLKFLFAVKCKKTPRSGIVSRKLDLQGQRFAIKLSKPTTSIFSLSSLFLRENMLPRYQPAKLNGKAFKLLVKVLGLDTRFRHLFHSVVKKNFSII